MRGMYAKPNDWSLIIGHINCKINAFNVFMFFCTMNYCNYTGCIIM